MLIQGTILSSRYRIESILGQGGMGAVYLATTIALNGKKVAVKEMEMAGLHGRELEQAVRQFQKEATFLAHLDHPNLVKVSDYFFDGGKHYLVMAYVEGKTLQQILQEQERPFKWEEIKDWTHSLLDVLSYLHNQSPSILFRDLKPSNVMIGPDRHLRLIDFGIARVAASGDKTSTFLRGTGTKGFSPIEQYGTGQSTDARSDLYALAGTIYYLLSGKLPTDAVERVAQRKPLMPLSHWMADAPLGLDGVLEKALALAKQERYPSATAFKRALSEIGERPQRITKSKPTVVEFWPAERPSSNWKKKLATATATFVGLLVLGSAATSATTLDPTILVKSDSFDTAILSSNISAAIPEPVSEVLQAPAIQTNWRHEQVVQNQSASNRQEAEAAARVLPTDAPTSKLRSKRLRLSLGEERYPKARVTPGTPESSFPALSEEEIGPSPVPRVANVREPSKSKTVPIVTTSAPVSSYYPAQYPVATAPQGSATLPAPEIGGLTQPPSQAAAQVAPPLQAQPAQQSLPPVSSQPQSQGLGASLRGIGAPSPQISSAQGQPQAGGGRGAQGGRGSQGGRGGGRGR